MKHKDRPETAAHIPETHECQLFASEQQPSLGFLRSRASDPPSRWRLHGSVEREGHPPSTRDVRGVTTTCLIDLLGKNTTHLSGDPGRQRRDATGRRELRI